MGLQRETNKSRRRLMVFGIFAIRLIVPAVGLGLLFIAPLMLDLKMQRGQGLITALPMFLTYLFVAHILGFTVFGGKGRTPGVFDIDPEQALRGYRLTLGLGFFVAIEALLVVAETAYRVSPETRAIIATFIIVIGAVPLWRLGRLLLDINAGKSAAPGTDTTGADPTEGAIVGDLIWIVARLIQIAAIVAVVASALGFVNLARQATVPMIFTLGVLAAALYFRRLLISLVRDAVGEITEDEAEGAFVLPLVVSLLIIFGVLPLLALIWGARLTDISEVWRLLTEGVKVGDMRLSLTMLITLVVVFMMGLVVTRWTQRLFRQTLLPRTKMDRGAQASLITGLGYLGLTLTGLIAISSAGIDLSSLAVVFGALSVGIGFGLRNVVSNFVSGIILLVERPVKVGDWIEVAGHSGIVKKIAVRSTRIETFDRFDVVVPNAALIEGSVKNMTLAGSDGRLVLPVGVAYGSDVDAVRTILEEAVKDDSRIISFPAPSVLFVGLGDSALDFELRVFLHDVSTVMGVKSDLLFRVYSALNKAGIEIPFPQRDVNLKGLERLAEAIETLGRRNGDAGA
ncbi:mechanosensitive ion channel family protein [Thalassovita sp.]|uniref:mechanosensitive ion channel family protein n=1 Tax=Thalassovita sp. TaxID=1979401 RepID=UPI002B26722D|nr:mechanosensitive ion channel domain-containing protein [Thalassovita sp.]